MPKRTTKPPHIYLFVGPDSFSIAEKIAAWKNRFAEKYSAAAISVFDCEEMGSGSVSRSESVPDPISSLKNALSGRTLFSTTSLLIVKNVFSKKAGGAQEMLCNYLPKLSGETFCVLVAEKRDPQSELSKLLTQLSRGDACEVEEFIIPTGPALKNWIVARTKTAGGLFDPRALAVFTGALEQQSENDEDLSKISLWHCDNEIKKLVSYCAGKPITVADVGALSCLPASAHVFNLSDALLAGNTTVALQNAHRLTPLLRALAFLMTQFRSFLLLKNMEEDGQSEEVVAKTLSWNPKRVWVVRKKLQRHTTQSLKAAYTGLLDLERDIKTGNADPLLSLDLFIKKTTELTQ